MSKSLFTEFEKTVKNEVIDTIKEAEDMSKHMEKDIYLRLKKYLTKFVEETVQKFKK